MPKLSKAEVDYSDLAICAVGKKEAGGAGLKLLHDHYETILERECCVDLHSAETISCRASCAVTAILH